MGHLRRVVNERGDVTLRAFCRELEVSPATIERIGTWGELRREAGLPRRARTGRPSWETQQLGDLFDPQTEGSDPLSDVGWDSRQAYPSASERVVIESWVTLR